MRTAHDWRGDGDLVFHFEVGAAVCYYVGGEDEEEGGGEGAKEEDWAAHFDLFCFGVSGGFFFFVCLVFGNGEESGFVKGVKYLFFFLLIILWTGYLGGCILVMGLVPL